MHRSTLSVRTVAQWERTASTASTASTQSRKSFGQKDQIWDTAAVVLWFPVRFPAGGADQAESPRCVWRPLLDTEAAGIRNRDTSR